MDKSSIMLVSSMVLMVVLFILFFMIAFIYNTKLFFYIKKTYPHRWEEVTTISGFGPGSSNPSRWLKYVFSGSDSEDSVVSKLKANIIFGLKCSIFMFAGIVVEMLLIYILH